MQEDICWGKLGSFKAKQSHQWALEENSKYLHDTSSVRGLWKVIWKGRGKMRAKLECVFAGNQEEEIQERQRRKSNEELKKVQTSAQTRG